MNVVYSYHLSLNAMNSISIHEYFSGCWAETEIMILCTCTLLSWHSSSVWSTDRRHRRVSDPHFWDPERDRIRHVEAADNHLRCCQTLSHSEVMLSFCTDCSHNFLSVLFHYASEPLIYLLFWFTLFLLFDQVFSVKLWDLFISSLQIIQKSVGIVASLFLMHTACLLFGLD